MGKKAARICWIGTALLTLWVTGCVRSGTEPPPTRQSLPAATFTSFVPIVQSAEGDGSWITGFGTNSSPGFAAPVKTASTNCSTYG